MKRDDYCRNLDNQLSAWKSNVETLMTVAEKMPGKDPEADIRQIENVREVIQGLGNVKELLKQECTN
jgi:hypothetical protein